MQIVTGVHAIERLGTDRAYLYQEAYRTHIGHGRS